MEVRIRNVNKIKWQLLLFEFSKIFQTFKVINSFSNYNLMKAKIVMNNEENLSVLYL